MIAVYATAAAGITLIPATIAATHLWHRLIDFHDTHTDRPSGLPIRPTNQKAIGSAPGPRQPIAEIADVPYRTVHDEILGDLLIGPQVPAHLFNALTAVNTVNTGGAL